MNQNIKKNRIPSAFKVNFQDERAKIIKVSNELNLDEFEENSFIDIPKSNNYRVKNIEKTSPQKIIQNYENNYVNSSNQKMLNNRSNNKAFYSDDYIEEEKNSQKNIEQIILNRAKNSKNYISKNKNFLHYLNNSNNNIIDLNYYNNNDLILPSTSEMIRIPNEENEVSISRNNYQNRNMTKNAKRDSYPSPEKYNISNYDKILNNPLYDMNQDKIINLVNIQKHKDSYSPTHNKLQANNNVNYNNNASISKISKRPSSILLPNINISRSRNDLSMNKRHTSMIKSNSNNESSIDNSGGQSYRKKSPYYFNNPKLNRLMEERNHNISISQKLKNLANLEESQVKKYNHSRIIQNTRHNISLDDVEDFEIL